MILLIDIKGINIVLSLLVRILVHYGKLLMQFFFKCSSTICAENCHSLPSFWEVLSWTYEFLFIWCFPISYSHSVWYSNFYEVPKLACGSSFSSILLAWLLMGMGVSLAFCHNKISQSHLVFSLLSTCEQAFLQGVLVYFIRERYLETEIRDQRCSLQP